VGTRGFVQRVLNRSEMSEWVSVRVEKRVGTRIGETGGRGNHFGIMAISVPPLDACYSVNPSSHSHTFGKRPVSPSS
jgi:hypothetical protein